jgi:3-hydroxybutyryl-CoA dehydrogenase
LGTVGVVGAGVMGAGIAQVALEAGWKVRLHDALPGAAKRGQDRVADGLRRRAAKLLITGDEAARWMDERIARLTIALDPRAVADGADLVIEAIVEDLVAKRALFAALDAAASPETILATNTSALSVTAIAEAAAAHPERVLGLHFFNPAPVLPLVEVVAATRTDPRVLERATAIVTAWGKTPVRSADGPGFIVNRVNRPFTIQALRMIEAGEARVAEIDAAMRAAGFPMGPFELVDLVGVDVNLAAATGVWEGLGRPDRLRPSPIQAWLVAHKRLGRKSGVGFYRHDAGHDPVPEPIPRDVAAHVRAGRSLAPAEIVRRIRSAIGDEAVLACDAGVATEADIDTALWLGAAHPEGPFAWRRRHNPTIPA